MYGRETTLWSPFLKGAEDCRGGSVGAKGHSRESTTVEPPSLSGSLSGNSSVLVAAVLAALVVVWAAANLVVGGRGLCGARLGQGGGWGGGGLGSGPSLRRPRPRSVPGRRRGLACPLGSGRIGGPGPGTLRIRVSGAADPGGSPGTQRVALRGLRHPDAGVRALHGGSVPRKAVSARGMGCDGDPGRPW